MKFDTHVHTIIEGNKPENMTIDELIPAAKGAGVDGIVITEHNTVLPDKEFHDLQQKAGDLIILQGVEFGCTDGFDYLVYGSTGFLPLEEVITPWELVNTVHEEGGFVAVAHPYRPPDKVIPSHIYELGLDGVEVKSFNLQSKVAQVKCLALARELNCVPIAGTDHHAHCPDRVGKIGIELERRVNSISDFVQELKKGHLKIYDRVDF